MIDFQYEADFKLDNESDYSDWLNRIIVSEGKCLKELTFIFCDDAYLLDINQKYLQHDDYTDIITFDYTDDNLIGGDIFISIARVKENARTYKVEVVEELQRVMAHGVLHLMGYSDKTQKDISIMRSKEEEKIKLFHVEQ